MKTERNILIAFILNFAFSIFEFVGGFLREVLPSFQMRFTILETPQASASLTFLKRKAKSNPTSIIPMAMRAILLLAVL